MYSGSFIKSFSFWRVSWLSCSSKCCSSATSRMPVLLKCPASVFSRCLALCCILAEACCRWYNWVQGTCRVKR